MRLNMQSISRQCLCCYQIALKFKTLSLSQICGSLLCIPGPLGRDSHLPDPLGQLSCSRSFAGQRLGPQSSRPRCPFGGSVPGPTRRWFFVVVPRPLTLCAWAPSVAVALWVWRALACWGLALCGLFYKTTAHSRGSALMN